MTNAHYVSRVVRGRAPSVSDAIKLPSLELVLIAFFGVALWFGGGASAADVWGQVLVRGVSTSCLVIVLLFGARPSWRLDRPAILFVSAALALVLVQLIPLPPAIWGHLPGRAPFVHAAALAGQAQPWRPIAIVPSGAENAAGSLIVPLAAVVLLAALRPTERKWMSAGLLVLITGAALVGLVQSTASTYQNPLINDVPGVVSGVFANRNHFSLFLAVGCVLAPAWACSQPQRGLSWRGPLALGMVLLFSVLIVVSGSRAGIPLGGLAVVAGVMLVSAPIRAALRGYPRWVFPLMALLVATGMGSVIWASLSANRALAINRAIEEDVAGDIRLQAAPTIWEMTWHYFPAGSGAGGFDPIFRIHEPFSLLNLTYLNHAHNDFAEILLDNGAAGALLLLLGVLWWGWGSWCAWRAWFAEQSPDALLPCAASVALFLIGLASLVDYPARTPLMMSLLVLLSGWLNSPSVRRADAARKDH